ncbi:flagellin [Cobetia amphilecti]|uniref:flagellin N-terminal helical domain-containing protein n=1 Tax=Cobetia amphilecti TaxID=1055104 RepID=UPI00244C3284|nr:flagellin [Cobetia litoralis]MDH2422157.1 flagellin [Cobetia litoralis]
MASVINTNTLSMVTQQNLNQSQNALNTSMERLSSGMRINSAKDDAAGQAIANRMDSQITGLSQAQRNANDGISVAQTAEGALNQVNDNLQRVRELTVQAANGTNNAEDLQSIQDEITMRMDEIDRISEQTSFNGVNVLSEDQNISIQVGAYDGESISINLQAISQETLELDNLDVTNALSSVSAGDVNFNSSNISFGDSDFQSEATTVSPSSIDSATATIGKVEFSGTDITDSKTWEIQEFDGEQYAVNTDDDKVYTIESTAADTTNTTELNIVIGEEITGGLARQDGTSGKSFDFTGGAATSSFSVSKDNDDNYYLREETDAGTVSYKALTTTDISSDSNGVVSIDVSDPTQVSATAANMSSYTTDPLQAIDDALKQVDSMRSDLGAVQNRFDSAITNLATTETNLASAQSRIQDADYAEEVSSMTTAQILQQAGTSMLTQANQVPQNVLSLLG